MLADLTPQRFEGTVWRATRLNQDPLAFSYNGGRWAPPSSYQSVPVLYTSLEREGAIAEIASWLSMLVPRPSKPIAVHRLVARATDVITLDAPALIGLGVNFDRYGERSYAAMGEAPPSRTQEIGAALSFLGIDGLIVPSARWPCCNLILFDNLDNQIEINDDGQEQVDWSQFLGQSD
ncbi:MAG: RES family NAD+ phosphorylase [Rhizobiaceae bacterium]|nr:RES family NAD+ phosphorylase [Rhizobiaceae bacterium]MCV0408439.1 RES family NAD+ phosphorylase [Rhizobiaceae bacterium]